MNEKYTIFLDMDQVLSDFDKRFFEVFGVNVSKNTIERCFESFIDGKEFENLEMMRDADVLLDFVLTNFKNVYILTSTSRPEYFSSIASQKTKWLNKHGINIPCIFVPNSETKRLYASRYNVLVDDFNVNCSEWSDCCGLSILHTDAERTIKSLKKLFDSD